MVGHIQWDGGGGMKGTSTVESHRFIDKDLTILILKLIYSQLRRTSSSLHEMERHLYERHQPGKTQKKSNYASGEPKVSSQTMIDNSDRSMPSSSKPG